MVTEARPAPEATQLPARFAELLLSVSRRLSVLDQDNVEAVALSPLEAMVMRHIDAFPGTTPSRIAAHLGLRSSNTSAALRDLEAKGFVSRRVDPTDGRSVRVDPTPLAAENMALKRQFWVDLLTPLLAEDALVGATALLADLDRALEAAAAAAARRAAR